MKIPSARPPSWSSVVDRLRPGHGRASVVSGSVLAGVASVGRTMSEGAGLPIRQADGQQPAPADWDRPPEQMIRHLLARLDADTAAPGAAVRPLDAAILESLPDNLRPLVASLTRTQPSTVAVPEPATPRSGSPPRPIELNGLKLNGNEAALLALAARSELQGIAPGIMTDAMCALARDRLQSRLERIADFCNGQPDLHDPHAWKMLGNLVDSGAAGWAIVEKAARQRAGLPSGQDGQDGSGHSTTPQDRRTLVQAARVLDPSGNAPLAAVLERAHAIAHDPSPDEPRRLAARAMVALAAPNASVPDDSVTAAIRAVRNGLGSTAPGSDHAFANERVAKLAKWSNRTTEADDGRWSSAVRRAFHKNPLDRQTLSAGEAVRGKIDSALASMRATRESADRLSEIFKRLESLRETVGSSASGTATATLRTFIDESSYHLAVYDHWAKRPVASQQVRITLSDKQKADIKASIRADEGARADMLCKRVDMLDTLKPTALQETGWNLIGELRAAIGRHNPDDPTGADSRIVAAVAGIQDADTGQPLNNNNDDIAGAQHALRTLEDALLGIRSEDGARIDEHPECIRARARQATERPIMDRPLEQLAAHAARLEVNDSLVLRHGRHIGLAVPLAVANVAIGGVGGVAGELRASTGKDAVLSMNLTSTGGEIVIGTLRRDLLRAKVGGVGGFGGDHVMAGVSGTAGYTFEGSGTHAVVLRIPRTGVAIGTGHGRGKPGIEGDRIVAQRMAEVLRTVDGWIRQDRTAGMVEKLLLQFPDLQITTVRDKRLQPSERTHRGSVDVAAGVGYVASEPPDAAETDSRHGFSLIGGAYAVEASRRTTHIKENGPYGVENLGTRKAVTGTGSVQILGALPGSQSHLASAQWQTHNRAAVRIAKVAMEDGMPNANSSLSEQAPSPTSPHGQALLQKRIWELAAFKLGLDDPKTLAAEVERCRAAGLSPDARIAELLRNEAYALTRAIEAWPDTIDSSFLMVSMITPTARTEIGQLDAIGRLARNDGTMPKVAAEADKARRRAILDDTSYTARFARQVAEQTRESSTGSPVAVFEKTRSARATGAGHII
ncbi:MAG: hypothetical protein RJA99_3936 [Pseudomonadota bacterium]